jgi:NitT/TauT family transport system ATP-binding protein
VSRAGTFDALVDVSFNAVEKEFISIVGPSGCGKTTLLKIIAGLLPPTSGKVSFSSKSRENGSVQSALVFQRHGLFPWMNVLENVAFGLEMLGLSRKERTERSMAFIRRIGLGPFVGAYPHELSTGMCQRVGIARAFVSDPDVLLLDEPFASLDAQTRLVLQEELLDIWRKEPKVVILVTHDIDEAILLGDRVLLISGRPGSIKEEIDIPVPRPRDHATLRRREVMDIKDYIWQELQADVRSSLSIAKI